MVIIRLLMMLTCIQNGRMVEDDKKIHLLNSVNLAPIQGQLVPMAVPLSGPRMESGLTYSAPPPPGPLTTSTPASQPPVSALKNVAMVSVPVEDDLRKPQEPELGKQVGKIRKEKTPGKL